MGFKHSVITKLQNNQFSELVEFGCFVLLYQPVDTKQQNNRMVSRQTKKYSNLTLMQAIDRLARLTSHWCIVWSSNIDHTKYRLANSHCRLQRCVDCHMKQNYTIGEYYYKLFKHCLRNVLGAQDSASGRGPSPDRYALLCSTTSNVPCDWCPTRRQTEP